MKFLTILIVIVYLHDSKALFKDLKIPLGFDTTNVKLFNGFNSSFDGQDFNPFRYNIDDIFQRFVRKYKRNYSEKEKHQRKENLRKSIEEIAKIIINFISKGIVPTFQVGLNGIADKSDDEYRNLYGTRETLNRTVSVFDRQKPSTIKDSICIPKTNTALPASLDWRQQNIVTPVKNQKSCGSCWAFATTATIESQWAKKTKQLIDLSEQDLVNCASTHGCNGETIDAAFNYVKAKGQAMEASVPYTAKVGQCKHYPLVNGVQINDYCVKRGQTEDSKIMRDLVETGPLVGFMNANDLSTRYYVSGIYDLPNCSKSTNHAITLIGWGTQNNVDFWIAKNSWDTTWGENGYFRIVRGKNMCGINTIYYYPILTNITPFSKTS